MKSLKKVWITKDGNLFGISLESIDPVSLDGSFRTHFREFLFPDTPSVDHPKRHVVHIGLFDKDDLTEIRNVINNKLRE